MPVHVRALRGECTREPCLRGQRGRAREMWCQEKSSLIPLGTLECKLLHGRCPAWTPGTEPLYLCTSQLLAKTRDGCYTLPGIFGYDRCYQSRAILKGRMQMGEAGSQHWQQLDEKGRAWGTTSLCDRQFLTPRGICIPAGWLNLGVDIHAWGTLGKLGEPILCLELCCGIWNHILKFLYSLPVMKLFCPCMC